MIVWIEIEVKVVWCGVATLVVQWGVRIWILLSRVIFCVISLGIRADIAAIRR